MLDKSINLSVGLCVPISIMEITHRIEIKIRMRPRIWKSSDIEILDGWIVVGWLTQEWGLTYNSGLCPLCDLTLEVPLKWYFVGRKKAESPHSSLAEQSYCRAHLPCPIHMPLLSENRPQQPHLGFGKLPSSDLTNLAAGSPSHQTMDLICFHAWCRKEKGLNKMLQRVSCSKRRQDGERAGRLWLLASGFQHGPRVVLDNFLGLRAPSSFWFPWIPLVFFSSLSKHSGLCKILKKL